MKKWSKTETRTIFYGNTMCWYTQRRYGFLYKWQQCQRLLPHKGQAENNYAFSLKMAEVELIKEKTGAYPVLLLDDVLSELDKNRQDYILKSINNIQTIITCTGLDEITRNIGDKIKIFRVKEGKSFKFWLNCGIIEGYR